jgi:hypothetical protein
MVDRLDEDRLEALRAWGTNLATDGREELRAAGKAIMMLVEEIDRLQLEARHERDERRRSTSHMERSDRENQQEAVEPVSSQSLGASLRERLGVAIPGRTQYGRDD